MRAFLTIFVLLGVFVYAENETYMRKLVKNRAKVDAVKGFKKHKRKLYIYADDKEIRRKIKESENRKEIDIASPVIGKHDFVREINIVVESKKPVKVKGVKNFSIASPTIDRRNDIRKVRIDLKLDKKVEIE